MAFNINKRDDQGRTPLHLATEENHEHVVSVLLKAKADCNAVDNNQLSPLHIANKLGHTECVRRLIDDSDINAKSSESDTPLMLACKHNKPECVSLMLKAQADINVANKDGYQPIHIAIEQDSKDVVSLLVNHDLNIERGENGRTPFHIASDAGNDNFIAYLKKTDNDINAQDKHGDTPLHLASCRGHTNTVSQLLKHGADHHVENDKKQIPLHVSSKHGHLEITDKLLDCPRNELPTVINRKDNQGRTPLLYATEANQKDIVNSLLDAGADGNVKDNDHLTPLHLANKMGHISCVEILIHHCDIDCVTMDNEPAVMLACQNSHTKCVETMLNVDADIIRPNKDGSRPIHAASEQGNKEIVSLLLHHKKRLPQRVLNDQDNNGNTALYLASWKGHTEVVSLLLDYKADPNLSNKEGCTPLHVSCQYEHIDIANILIPISDVNKQCGSGQTPLAQACATGAIKCVKRLIEAGADTLKTDKQFLQPIHFAAKHGHPSIISVLLDHKASVDAATPYGETPLYSACKAGQIDVVQLLLDKEADAALAKHDGNTALHWASMAEHNLQNEQNRADIIPLLVANKCNVNGRNDAG